MLPNKKLYKSSEKPPDNPISTTPTASPADNNTATAESPGIFVDSLNFVIPREAIIETAKAVHIGYMFVNKPTAIPPNATCDRASPYKDCFLKTNNRPIVEQLTATAIPEINAR